MSDQSQFVHKRLDLTFILGEGDLKGQTVKITGLRASMLLSHADLYETTNLQLRVWGMTLNHMNALSTLGRFMYQRTLNILRIEAGDPNGVSLVYQGYIMAAWADFNDMPNVVFYLIGSGDVKFAMEPIPPTSFKGSADVATLMSVLAQAGNLRLINQGVNIKVSDPYLHGTAREQMIALAQMAHIETDLDETHGTLTIWPRGGSRTESVLVISPETGLVKYPAYTSGGLLLTIAYNPSIIFGQIVEVKSSLKPACGKWNVKIITHLLDAELPGGNWFTVLEVWALNRPSDIPTDTPQEAPSAIVGSAPFNQAH